MKTYIDISNYVSTRVHTGIQRVVREFLFHLIHDKKTIDYSIVYYNIEEKQFIVLSNSEVLSFLKNTKDYVFQNILNKIPISNIKEPDIFYDMDGTWGHSLKRTYLYKKLKKQNVYIVNFLYDMVPIVKPEFAHENTIVNFTTFIYAVYQYSDLVLFDSRSAEKDFLTVQKIIGSDRNISTRVIKLGSDIKTHLHAKTTKHKNLISSKYILFVGTLEPRKNQALVLKVFEKLTTTHSDLNLVFIGKEGWNNAALIRKIRSHKSLNKKVFWLENINDAELFEFYENAFVCTYLSEYEGFGLPIAESLAHGKITITSNNSSMYEVGKNYADYLTYNSFNELYETIEMYLKDEDLYNAKLQYIKEYYTPYTWELMYKSTIAILSTVKNHIPIISPEKLQFVIISIDKENLIGTLNAIDRYVDFVKEYIIITSNSLLDSFKTLNSKHKIVIINENDILQKYSVDFQKRDHQSKNWLLRSSLLQLDNLDQQFIMLDDDNRPLKDISIEHFIQDGKYNAYYFYDLLEWNSFQTEYDVGQHNMKKVLDKDAYELLSYSSHKPQIVDKTIFQEIVDKYFEIGLNMPIDEWSTYFNYAVSKYPYLFNKRKYDTLNWPANPSDWPMKYIPEDYNFENFYNSLYDNGVFKDKKTSSLEEKIIIKKNQLIPYSISSQRMKALSKYYTYYDMVHGVMSFNINKKLLYILNMPYYLESKVGTWLKIPLNFKALSCNNSNVKLMYYINKNNGAYTTLPINKKYEDNKIEFSISCTSLQIGEYDLLIDVFIDNNPVFGLKSPYLVKLKIVGE